MTDLLANWSFHSFDFLIFFTGRRPIFGTCCGSLVVVATGRLVFSFVYCCIVFGSACVCVWVCGIYSFFFSFSLHVLLITTTCQPISRGASSHRPTPLLSQGIPASDAPNTYPPGGIGGPQWQLRCRGMLSRVRSALSLLH